MIDTELDTLARRVGEALAARGWRLATAESCTGGWIAEAVTAIGGSSAWFDRGFVTYSNAAKAGMLGVPMPLIEAVGAVSAEVARAMAQGAIVHSAAAIAVAVTGIAGPGGATATKPIGLVHFATARRGGTTVDERHVLPGDRAAIRRRAVAIALRMIREAAAR